MPLIDAGSTSGLTLYAVVRDEDAKVANGSAFETFNASHWGLYAVPLVEQGTSGYYVGTFPVYADDGDYSVAIYQQNGASPDASDVLLGINAKTISSTPTPAASSGTLAEVLQAQLDAINAAITTALTAGPVADWSVGDVSFKESGNLETLYEQRDKLIEQLRKIPSEVYATVQNDVDALGHDGTEYFGDDF